MKALQAIKSGYDYLNSVSLPKMVIILVNVLLFSYTTFFFIKNEWNNSDPVSEVEMGCVLNGRNCPESHSEPTTSGFLQCKAGLCPYHDSVLLTLREMSLTGRPREVLKERLAAIAASGRAVTYLDLVKIAFQLERLEEE